MSETATARTILSHYCVGVGIDIGAGGDPINLTALCVDHPNPQMRAHTGDALTHLACDARNLPFVEGSLDYVYSSHCLEDFEDTHSAVKEWLRVLKPGGNLVLFLPDQPAYAAYCAEHNALPNQAHKHNDFSLVYMMNCLQELGIDNSAVVQSLWPFPGNPYSFSLVIKKP